MAIERKTPARNVSARLVVNRHWRAQQSPQDEQDHLGFQPAGEADQDGRRNPGTTQPKKCGCHQHKVQQRLYLAKVIGIDDGQEDEDEKCHQHANLPTIRGGRVTNGRLRKQAQQKFACDGHGAKQRQQQHDVHGNRRRNVYPGGGLPGSIQQQRCGRIDKTDATLKKYCLVQRVGMLLPGQISLRHVIGGVFADPQQQGIFGDAQHAAGMKSRRDCDQQSFKQQHQHQELRQLLDELRERNIFRQVMHGKQKPAWMTAGIQMTLQVIAVALFFFMPLQGELDQAVDQLFVGEPAGLPQLGVHADRSKSGSVLTSFR